MKKPWYFWLADYIWFIIIAIIMDAGVLYLFVNVTWFTLLFPFILLLPFPIIIHYLMDVRIFK